MFNFLIRFSLHQRTLVIAIALMFTAVGLWQATRMPIDVFPDLNRPRVVIMTEAPGMAPEEVETLVTLPIESVMNGANHVEAVRSSSGVGISVVYVEFEYGTDIYLDRQLVAERLQEVQNRLPSGISPQLAPVSSIMGQILMLGMWSESDDVSAMELRTAADWIVRQRLMTIPGVSQVFVMGGDRKQYQVLVDPASMLRLGVNLHEIEGALRESNENGTGGYLVRQGPNELLVRTLGRIESISELEEVPVASKQGVPILLRQVANVQESAQNKRGDSSAYVRTPEAKDRFSGGNAVVLTINKQPGADTRLVTTKVQEALEELRKSLPSGVRIEPTYSLDTFIDRAIANVAEALRDGVLLVVVILYLFLLNFRTTFITITAIPLSLMMTSVVFAAMGLSINTMTLGGLAVAMGELVDDAIVDVENIHRRLKENWSRRGGLSSLSIIYQASFEVRRSIVFSTAIVVLVFVPLFFLQGMEGRLFRPLGIAYIVSIVCSLIVSLTVTPVLSYWLLGKPSRRKEDQSDGWVVCLFKQIAQRAIRLSLAKPRWILGITVCLVLISAYFISRVERDFLPAFNEGTIQLNVMLPPGSSLSSSNRISAMVEKSLMELSGVTRLVRRTGRAELDEHAEGVHMSEFLIDFDPNSSLSRTEQLEQIRLAMAEIPGIVTSVEQPISHLISHMLTGVKAQVGMKIYGDDLEVLRKKAIELQSAISDVPGVTDLLIEPQVLVPQLRLEINRSKLSQYGLSVGQINRYIETAMNGATVSQILEGMRSYDLVVKLSDEYREDLEGLKRLAIPVPGGGVVPLGSVVRIYESSGPNIINRENVRRRVLVQCNVKDRGVVDVVEQIRKAALPVIESLPEGYYLAFEGQFQNQQSATRTLALLFMISLLGVFLVLFALFRTTNLALQVMAALPMAFIGAVAALLLTGQTITLAALVGFVSLTGIASRNGVLLLQHYLHLVEHEGESFTKEMIVRAGLERMSPVMMTALTAGIALIPLVWSAGEAGKEILYPVATVILGGLVSSTILDFFVHPALFWMFGIRSAQRSIESRRNEGFVSNA